MSLLAPQEIKHFKDQLEPIFASIIHNSERRSSLIQLVVEHLEQDLRTLERAKWDNSYKMTSSEIKEDMESSNTEFHQIATYYLKKYRELCFDHECVAIYRRFENISKTEGYKKFTELLIKKYAAGYAQAEMEGLIEAAYGEPVWIFTSKIKEKHASSTSQLFLSHLKNNVKQFKRCRSIQDIQDVIDGKVICKKHYLLPCFFKADKNHYKHEVNTSNEESCNIF